MSGTRYNSSSGGPTEDRVSNVAQNLGAMGSVLRELIGTMNDLQGAVLREVAAGLRDAGLPQFSLRNARSCRFPDYSSCNPNLGTLVRDAHPGETVRVPIRLRNTTSKRRRFTFRFAGPLKDSQGRTTATPTVTPENVDLDEKEVGQVVVQVSISDEFAVGAQYSTRLLVQTDGCEDQHLTISIFVPGTEGPVIRLCCPCDPKVRPLRWYNHYYCDPPQ